MKRLVYLAPHRSFDEEWNGWFSVGFGKGLRSLGVPEVRAHRFRWIAYGAKVLRYGRLIRNLATLRGRAYLVTLPHISEFKLFPATYFHEIIPYAFDCWPYRYDEWERFFRRHDVKVAFFSARHSFAHFSERLKGTTCLWMPEACDAESYRPGKPLAERSVAVLEFGRRKQDYHDHIRPSLAAHGHRHEFMAGEATRERLIELLADSKISICFPRTMTWTNFPAGMETLTVRYFEVMASGGLVVGRCPQELHDLFGYNPVIEADLERPCEQLESLLRSIGDYQPLVDRNYATLMRVGTWERRAAEILAVLRERGYQPESSPA